MRLRALDLFCGGGGSSYGAREAGATIACAIDAWKLATKTFESNFPDTTVLTRKLEWVRPGELQRRIGKVNLLLASPECTNHTPARGSAKRSENSRRTALEVLRFSRVFEPRWVVIENVIQMRKWRRYGSFIENLKEMGYHIREQVLNAKDFGAPQTRRRLFILCDRAQDPPLVKPRTNRRIKNASDVLDRRKKWKSKPLFNGHRADNTIVRYLTGLWRVGPSKPFLLVYYGSDGAGGWQSLDRPLRTITTVDRFGLVVPNGGQPELRMLQVSELQRAMGFGGDYKLEAGTRRDRIKLLGNAVCPPVIKAVVSALTRSARRERRSRRNVQRRKHHKGNRNQRRGQRSVGK